MSVQRHALNNDKETKKKWHDDLKRMLKSGEIIKPKHCVDPNCSFPEETRYIQGHSPDYSKSPKENVMWLCTDCHSKWHGWRVGFDYAEEDARYYARLGGNTRKRTGASKIGAQKAIDTQGGVGSEELKERAQLGIATKLRKGIHNGLTSSQAEERDEKMGHEKCVERARKGAITQRLRGTAKGGTTIGAQKMWVTRRSKNTIGAQQGVITRRLKGTDKIGARKRLETIGHEGFVALGKKAAASLTHEQLCERARKSAETKRLKKQLAVAIQKAA